MKLNLILKHIEKYIVIAAAVIVIILDIFNITSNYIIFEAILAVLALLMFSLIKFENKFDKLKLEGRLNNIKYFNINRANLPSFEETFDKAKEEIVIWAACFGSGINKIRLIQNKLEQRCKVKILLMALLDENGNKNSSIAHAAEISKNTGLENRLNTAHKELRDFYTSLDKEFQNLLEIRTYLKVPTATFLLINKDTNKGFIIVEPSFIGFWADELPSFEVTQFIGSGLYNVIKRSFNETWSNSKPFISK